MFGLRGTAEGRQEDPFWVTPPSPLESQALQGPVSKERREDLQTLSFALALSLVDNRGHPIEITRGSDPPDRVITTSSEPCAVELTELTITDIRRELAQARHLGRLLHAELTRGPHRFRHLAGRRIALAVIPTEQSEALEEEPLLDKLCAVLETDRGCVGDGVDVSAGFPEHWPNDNGFYGRYGPVVLMAYRDGPPGEVMVSSSCQAQVSLSQTLAAVNERVQAKDRESNDLLLMSCGMPDSRGYVCPTDQFMFRFIQEHVSHVNLCPVFLRRVILHLWGTAEWIELFKAQGAELVWPPPRV